MLRFERLSSAIAPISLIVGFEVGAARQPAAYSPLRDTISALAARDATDRWIMTTAFVALGSCHVVTACGLRRPLPARALLAAGGLATVLIAFAPQPAHGSSALHLALAGIGLTALAVWPVFADRGERVGAAVLLVALLWFVIALQTASVVGLAERVLTVAEALWPIVVVWRTAHVRRPASVRHGQGSGA